MNPLKLLREQVAERDAALDKAVLRVAELEADRLKVAYALGSPKDADRLPEALSYVLASYRQRAEAAEARLAEAVGDAMTPKLEEIALAWINKRIPRDIPGVTFFSGPVRLSLSDLTALLREAVEAAVKQERLRWRSRMGLSVESDIAQTLEENARLRQRVEELAEALRDIDYDERGDVTGWPDQLRVMALLAAKEGKKL